MLFTRIKIRCGGGIISLFAADCGPTNLVKKTKSQPFPNSFLIFSFFTFVVFSSRSLLSLVSASYDSNPSLPFFSSLRWLLNICKSRLVKSGTTLFSFCKTNQVVIPFLAQQGFPANPFFFPL